MSTYPDFICLGPQRTGSTWLHYTLTKYGNVYSPAVKEVHYFDHVHIPRRIKLLFIYRTKAIEKIKTKTKLPLVLGQNIYRLLSLFAPTYDLRFSAAKTLEASLIPDYDFDDSCIDDAWYASRYKNKKPSQIAVDFTASYCLLDAKAIQHILRLNPDTKFLLTLRDPVERVFSHAKMVLKKTNPNIDSESLLHHALNAPIASAQNDYETILATWQDIVPEHQLKIMFFEDLEHDPQTYLAEVCEFAGIKFPPKALSNLPPARYVTNEDKMTEETRVKLLEKYSKTIDAMQELYPEKTKNWGFA
jgi:hypothetical protein